MSWRHAQYILLGDDIMIYNHFIALQYYDIMSTLGVNISPSKSHMSNKFYEFAKRYYYEKDGAMCSISPYPISAMEEVHKDLSLVTNFYMEIQTRAYGIGPVQDCVRSFYTRILHRPSRNVNKLVKESIGIQTVLLLIQRKLDLASAFKELGKAFSSDIPSCIDDSTIAFEALSKFIRKKVLSVFEQRESQNNRGKPLGYISHRLAFYVLNSN